jgi:cytochrome c-type biogenesis protein CcsB
MKLLKTMFFAIAVLTGLSTPLEAAQTRALRPAESILIQHNGRVKSFLAFSEQTIEQVTGKTRWNGKTSLELIFDAIAKEEAAGDIPWVSLDYGPLAQKLGLPTDRHFFSYHELTAQAEVIESMVRQSQAKRDKDQRPEKIEQKAETLFGQLIAVKQLITRESLKVIPSKEHGHWQSPYTTIDPLAPKFKELVAVFARQDWQEFGSKTQTWNNEVSSLAGGWRGKTTLEVFYLKHRPFQISWIAYLLCFVCLSLLSGSKVARIVGVLAFAVGIVEHTLGLALRVMVLGRPPVSNMYESMVYMNWALAVFACLFSGIKKNLSVLSIASLLSGIIMIYASLLPIDSSLEVLVPVLRSNYWLTIHVLTIVSSYGALGLAMGLGHRHLILWMRKKWSKKSEDVSAQTIYRVIQLGALLLGFGTFLGGVWANESWGRFWGWDPKETWALITFLGYLIVVHLRSTKKINNFWLALSSVLGFLLVVMTWYGVNFVLGRGLHSYGQGAGGMIWVVYYLIFEVFFVMFTLTKKWAR